MATQRDGFCVQCGATEIHAVYLSVGTPLQLHAYTCAVCGYTELHAHSPGSAMQMGQKVRPVASIGTSTTALPPLDIEGVPVHLYASLDARVTPTGRHQFVWPDGSVTLPDRVVVGTDPITGMVYRFYCDRQWQVLSRAPFDTIADACDALERDYAGATDILSTLVP